MICDMCECESTLYFADRGRKVCHHCFWDIMDREPTVVEKVVEDTPEGPRHFCKTCTWMDRMATVPGGFHGACRVRPEPRPVCKDNFCGEHPAALRDRQALLGPSLDPAAMLAVAAGQFMGNYYSKALNTPGEDPKNTRAEDERTLQEIAEGIVEVIITDFHISMEKVSSAWTASGSKMQEAARKRWIELVKDRL